MKEIDQLVIFNRLKKGELVQRAAAKALGMSRQWVRKKLKRYIKDGSNGLIHRNRGRQSKRQWNVEAKAKAMALFESTFNGFGPTFAAEKLRELHNINVSRETLRHAMIESGHWQGKKRRATHRKLRQRKECYGEMIQLDGSPHHWFSESNERCTLLVFIDDATSKIPYAKLVPSESTKELMLALKEYIQLNGIPLSLYVDYGSVFSVNLNNQERTKTTQFERACHELGIRVIHASSPQAKGRVERSHGTHQDRLIKELALANITTMAQANQFITSVYLPKHNARYAIPAAVKGDVHLPHIHFKLDQIICLKENRTLQNNFVIQYKGLFLQLSPHQQAYIRPKDEVLVREFLDGSISLSTRNIILNFCQVSHRPLVEKPIKTLPPYVHHRPAHNHPWRQYHKTAPSQSIEPGKIS